MSFFLRLIERTLIFLIGIALLWIIVTRIYEPIHREIPRGYAIALTYFLAAYILIPIVIRVISTVLRRKHIPHYTMTGDGLPADPVFIALIGTEEELRQAFRDALWQEADPLTLKTGWKMVVTFLTNRSYPSAPFSSLYLFGRKQDIGFEQQIGNSPRKRHHVRFWAANSGPHEDLSNIRYWTTKHVVDPHQKAHWIGAGTMDTGFGLARFTYQVAHSVHPNIDQERDYILSSLREAGWIESEKYFNAGKPVNGKFVSDGRILIAKLASPARKNFA